MGGASARYGRMDGSGANRFAYQGQANVGWRETYDWRLTSAEAALSHVQSGQRIWISPGQNTPLLVSALLGRADELREVSVCTFPMSDFGWFSEAFKGRIDVSVLYATPFARDAVNEGSAEYIPWCCWGCHKATDDGRMDVPTVDVTFIRVSPPDSHGFCCLGTAVWDAKTTVRRARTVIAEVNANVPRTFGETHISVEDIDWFVVNDEPPPERFWVHPAPEPWDEAITGHISELVRDGDNLQIGTGSTTNNLVHLGLLEGKHDIGYFSELTVPGIIDLVRAGVINSRHLDTHPSKIITTAAGNSEEEMRFITGNPAFEFYPVEYVHDPRVISRNDNVLAVNMALGVDLTGQIAASGVGPTIYSGTGGQLSFALGAYLSRGGRYVCVMPATAAAGEVSRIAPQLPAGSVVTVPRDIADIVVTEFGVANLLNKTLRQRANELIAVAHPDFRGDLRKQAAKLF